MKINGIEFEATNEKVVPIVRPKETIFFIMEAIDDIATINDALERLPKPKAIVGGKPGEAMKPVVANTLNSRNDAKRFVMWQDGLIVHSLKYVTRDEIIQTPLTEPAEGWGETPEDERYMDEIVRNKYPMVWETVDLNDPTTWENWRTELKTSKINAAEITRIVSGCYEANSITEAAVEEAMQDFLGKPPQLAVLTVQSLMGVAGPSQSGEPVTDSESDLPE